MNNKFSVGVVIAIVLQVSAFVWWTAQQAQTIEQLEGQVAELTAKSEIEKEVQLASDVRNLQKELKELNDKTLEAILDVSERIDGLGNHANMQDEMINDTFVKQMTDFEERVSNTFYQVEEWIDEIDVDIERVYVHIDNEIEKLDKKLSDRISDNGPQIEQTK
jgi:hypothetical protein